MRVGNENVFAFAKRGSGWAVHAWHLPPAPPHHFPAPFVVEVFNVFDVFFLDVGTTKATMADGVRCRGREIGCPMCWLLHALKRGKVSITKSCNNVCTNTV